MNSVFGSTTHMIAFVLIVNTFIILLLGILLIVNIYKVKKLTKRYDKFLNAGFNGKNMEQLIDACLFKTEDVIDKFKEIQDIATKIESNMLKCTQKIGFTRYAAFENVGSDQSFSIAMLDATDNGIILTGIHTRECCAVYAKPIESGKSKFTLTGEEIQAIDRARRTFGERIRGFFLLDWKSFCIFF